jgi:hypothetical protein
MFVTNNFTYHTMTIHEIDLANLVEQICSSVQLTVKKVSTVSSITTDELTTNSTQVSLDTVQ